LTDACCRPIAFLLTGGQVADCTAADGLLDRLLAVEILHGDKGYDSDAVRRKIESKGAAPNIPPKINRRWKTASHPGSIVTATPSNACSVASKTFAGSPPATIASPATFSPPSVSPLPCATGYESGP
jgi:hypothetical protein